MNVALIKEYLDSDQFMTDRKTIIQETYLDSFASLAHGMGNIILDILLLKHWKLNDTFTPKKD